MTPPVSLPPTTGGPARAQGNDREQLAKAAKQFEAIFLRQLLSQARKSEFGAPLLGGEGLKTFRTMQDEHFAELASQSGAFGLAKQIEAQLASRLGRGSAKP